MAASNNSNNSSRRNSTEQPHSTPVVAPTLELKPLKNVMPIVPAQQVDSSSCPSSGQGSPIVSPSPNGTTLHHTPDNDEAGVENITQVNSKRSDLSN
ncbi:hypothetical protein BG004_005839 [Podila humilis]|nr:hypothetical protein BG004_005839 [Podila humilis]